MKRLPGLIKLDDYSLLILIQVRSQETTTRKLQNVKIGFTSLKRTLKRLRAQIVFSFFLAGVWDPERRRRTDQVNDWLHGCCHDQGFGFRTNPSKASDGSQPNR